MRLSVVLSDAHPAGVAPATALERDRALVAAARGRLDGITLTHGWATARWNPAALTMAAYLSADARPLRATVRGLPLGVVNPVELAEQLATVDHAWQGTFQASVSIGSAEAFAVLGVDPVLGPARFEESLDLVRRMWTATPLAGTGPQFRFSEVRPTLRPAQPQGPPLSLEATGGVGMILARRLRLGLHLGRLDDLDETSRLVETWQTLGGDGDVSLELDAGQASVDTLSALAAARVDQVDVRLSPDDVGSPSLLRLVAELARRRASVGAR